ncbi:chemotaxis protein CheA [Pleionea sp. CnH1-48]|uniref:chemotaxis protein CheA n=1 Tax=Pleionea sp. CnH1-48 TaxID=2954494 RepID=UPI0020974B62|nr:chemotaxis protein CheA [Pleionea sp. CnH1-48]MCO7226119.1 chemotaxis protein CheA [Pleionea sp. CnH1-48]
MSIDLSQFHQVFFEESFEGLEIMEQGLLGLSPGETDNETINSIFRAAHSIKGGSATFKFEEVSSFTHILETLLDEMRNGEREVTVEAVDLLLQSVDVLKDMLQLLQAHEPVPESLYKEISDALEAMVSEEGAGEGNGESAAVAESSASSNVVEATDDESMSWLIQFAPESHILRTGNEPSRMFKELSLLGEITVVCHHQKLPSLEEIEEELCYLSWSIILNADVDLLQIEEVFEWVKDESELGYEHLPLSAAEERLGTKASVAVDEVAPAAAVEATAPGSPAATPEAAPAADNRQLQVAPKKEVKDTAAADKKPAKVASTGSSSIRVGIDKVDSLINLVGELVITQSMLGQMGDDFNLEKLERLKEGLIQLEQNTRELQESVMRIRMLPISFVFNRFPRMVRDLAKKLDKEVELELIGEGTELDKTVMEQIGDPMVHLVRNSMDHGIESPDKREQAGKPRVGKVILNAYHQGGNIVIEITDDGAGINAEKVKEKAIERGVIDEKSELTVEQINNLIFEPGFSTADTISDVSGRGVGMDVVKRNINSLGGSVEVSSTPGHGSTFSIRLPLTLAILDGQVIRVGDQIFIVPLISIVESLQLKNQEITKIVGNTEVYRLREDHVPIVKICEEFCIDAEFKSYDDATVVVVEAEGVKVGLMVDELLAQQQVVIKSLDTNFISIDGISGATILGDGRVALILDIGGMIKRVNLTKKSKKAYAA